MDEFHVTDDEIELVAPILQRLVWSDCKTRAKIQKLGVNVIPVNLYSNTPSIEEINASYEYQEFAPYLSEDLFDNGVLQRVLSELGEYSPEFDPDIDGDENDCERFFWRNSQFSYSDAMAYYCFIRKFKPRRILEIGGGFSTLIAVEATQRNGSGQVTCVEPFPRPFLLKNANVELLKQTAQSLRPEVLNEMLQDGDFLFVDSTHTVKTGSDTLHFYLRLLPKIRKNIFVHIHDIYLPFGMPIDWLLNLQLYWTEQYLLMAFMKDNPKSTVLYGSAYHHAFNTQALEALMKGKSESGGASLWFKYEGGYA